MELYCKNTDRGLVPIYESDFEEKKKLKLNQVYKLDIKKARNYQFHKKFMALVKIGQENSKTVEMPFDVYRKYATIKAGFADLYTTPKGVFVEAKSISFSSMDETQFQEVYNRVLDFIIKDTGSEKELIEKELINFL